MQNDVAMAKTRFKKLGLKMDNPISALDVTMGLAKRRTSTARLASRIQKDGEPWSDAIRRAMKLENEIYPLATAIATDGESRADAVRRAQTLERLIGGRMDDESKDDFAIRVMKFARQRRANGDEVDSQESQMDCNATRYFIQDGQWYAESQSDAKRQTRKSAPLATGIFCPQPKHFLFVLVIFACAYVKWCL